MLELVDLLELEVIVTPKLGVASSHRVGSFQQIVAKEAVAGFNKLGMLGIKLTGLVLCPDEAGIFRNRRLGLKSVDVADFGDDAGGVNLANAGNGGQRVWDDLKLLLNGLVQRLDLALQGAHGGDRDGHDLVYRIVHRLGQTVGTSGSGLNSLGSGLRVSKPAASSFGDKRSKLIEFGISQIIGGFKMFHKGQSGDAGIGNIAGLGDARALEEQVVGEALLLPGEVLDRVESGPGERLERLITVVVHVDLLADPAESEMVGNDESVHEVVLGQVRIGLLEFPDLLGIENMKLPLELTQLSVLTERVDQAIPIDGSRLHADDDIAELHGSHCRHDSLCQQFSTAAIIWQREAAVLAAIRFHQVGYIVSAPHIDANVKWIHIFHLPAVGFQDQQAKGYPW